VGEVEDKRKHEGNPEKESKRLDPEDK